MPDPSSLVQPYGGRGLAERWVERGVNPAAGSPFSFPIPAEYVWRLTACTFTLTASAAAANRFATVQVIGGDGQPFVISGAGVVVTANSTARYNGSMYRATSEWAANTDVFFPLAPLFLEGGDTLKINVAGIDVADTLTLIYLVFDKFYETYPA